MAPYIVCIDGNIGAGKSTLLQELKTRGYHVHQEQVNGTHDHDWLWALENCYSDPKRWACTLQVAIAKSMAIQKKIIDAIDASIVFVERCPTSTIVFTNMWYSQQSLTDDELKLVREMHDVFDWTPNLTLMLTTTPNECYSRMLQRGRECEAMLPLAYLEKVAIEYEKVYADKEFTALCHHGSTNDIIDKVEVIIRNISDLTR